MYTVEFLIEPQDILNMLSDEDKERFNYCIFSDVYKDRFGGLTIQCNLIEEDKNVYISPEPEYRYKLCEFDSFKLH